MNNNINKLRTIKKIRIYQNIQLEIEQCLYKHIGTLNNSVRLSLIKKELTNIFLKNNLTSPIIDIDYDKTSYIFIISNDNIKLNVSVSTSGYFI